jgi:hypothetical protein
VHELTDVGEVAAPGDIEDLQVPVDLQQVRLQDKLLPLTLVQIQGLPSAQIETSALLPMKIVPTVPALATHLVYLHIHTQICHVSICVIYAVVSKLLLKSSGVTLLSLLVKETSYF